ncbi:MAG: long-chain fatty acid--CoA ligase, partial [Deltaproteobacteria bacterium]|nr:long-chain fatty acid--CoA ligase [Deltaproteobacteria bacterium]
MIENVYQPFEDLVRRFPSKDAVIYLGTPFTYAKLKDLVDRFGQGLHDAGIREGDSMIIYLPNCIQWVVAWLAAVRNGITAIPIAPNYTPRDLEYIANDSGAQAVVCLNGNFGYIKEILNKSPIRDVITTDLLDMLPFHKRLIGRLSGKIPKAKITKGANIYSFSRLTRDSSPSRMGVVPDKDRLAQILYTGGTTKHPKGVPITHSIFLAAAWEQTENPIRGKVSPEEDVTYGSAPMFHVLGQSLGLANIITGGGTLLLDPKVNLDVIFDSIQRLKVKSLIGVPAFYRMILEHTRLDQYDLSSLKYCFCGGDVLPQEVANRWLTRFNFPLSQGFGATETCGGVAMVFAGEDFPSKTVGRVLPSKKVRIVDQNTLQQVPVGTPGEMIVTSAEMIRSYWNKPEETAEAFVEIDGELWYKSADIVRMDEAGWLYFVDRTVDVIK